jgi:hypothetical protein
VTFQSDEAKRIVLFLITVLVAAILAATKRYRDLRRAIVINNKRLKTLLNGWLSQESSSSLTVWRSRMKI